MGEDDKKPAPESALTQQGSAANRLPVLDSAQLFAASHEIWIEHNGEIYRLQRTKAGKLILTK
jgi:hemin uptake protein HemP